MTAGAIAAISTPAQAQVDGSKHWYMTYMKANLPVNAKSGACARADIKFVFSPNMRANQLASPPAGYTRAFDNSKPTMSRSSGGWCPKSMSASACDAREQARAQYVWHNWLAPYACGSVRWNNSVIYSK